MGTFLYLAQVRLRLSDPFACGGAFDAPVGLLHAQCCWGVEDSVPGTGAFAAAIAGEDDYLLSLHSDVRAHRTCRQVHWSVHKPHTGYLGKINPPFGILARSRALCRAACAPEVHWASPVA